MDNNPTPMHPLLDFLRRMGFAQAFCLYAFSLCMAYFFWVTYKGMQGHSIPADISEIKICLIGISGSIVGYVVGSTKSSRDKDRALQQAIKNNNSTTTTNNNP